MVPALVADQLAVATTGWSIGVTGALAEFERDPSEPALVSDASVITRKGAIGLAVHGRTRAIAYETVSARPGAWLHGIALCLPRAVCRRQGRTTITEVGPDSAALRREDRGAILFDLGLGAECFDFCVRAADLAQVRVLRSAAGRRFLDDSALFDEIAHMSPHRVFMSALGRIEIYQRIGAEGGATPDGPHTHLIPRLLRVEQSHSANLPVPRDWVACATLYPAHPARDRMGEAKAFDGAQHDAFQALLAAHGDADSVAIKREVWQAVRESLPPTALPEAAGRHTRLARRVALRQMALIDGPSASLASWQQAFDRA